MHSPWIRDDLVQRLDREAARRNLQMTQLVDLIVEHALHGMEQEILPEVHEKGCGCGARPVPRLKGTASEP